MIAHASEGIEAWTAARQRAGRMLVALDFDGTLAEIVARPEDAALHPAAERALAALVRRPDTDVAIVSGRALEDVRQRVDLGGVYFAGNHGLEIEGPGIAQVHAEAAAARPRIAACAAALAERLSLPGTELEDKGLTLSIHYRRADHADAGTRIGALLDELCGSDPELRITRGKKVFEVRPAVEWDKGRATRFLRHALHAERSSLVPTLFIGDDVTDEDAFRAVLDGGAGILVAAEPPAETAAVAFLRSPAEVAEFLQALAQ